MQRDNGHSLSHVESDYRTGQGAISILKPGTLPIRQWERLLTQRGPHTGHDAIILAVGTPMQMLTRFHDFIVLQQPDTDNTALLAGATVTDGDADELIARQREQADWLRQAQSTGIGSVYVEHPPCHRVITKKVGNLSTTGGNGGNQERALLNLQTDPFTAPDIEDFVEILIRSFMDYDSLGCSLQTIEGGGGTHPLHQYAVMRLKASLKVNRHIRLFLTPTQKEPLHLANMRGTLANALKSEADDTLNLIHPQKKAGPHDTDIAVVSGMITLSGNCHGVRRGEPDPATKFNLITTTAGHWLSVHPRIVRLPLRPIGQLVPENGHLHDDRHWVSVPDHLGGKRVSAILVALHILVMEDPSAPHFLTIAGSLHPDEIEYIAKGIERFSLSPGGQVHVFFNPADAVVDPATNTAQALLCDFRGGQGVRAFLKGFLAEQSSAPVSTGISWDEVRSVAVQVPELPMAEKIEQQLLRILDNNPL
jgi:hypothetical protein